MPLNMFKICGTGQRCGNSILADGTVINVITIIDKGNARVFDPVILVGWLRL